MIVQLSGDTQNKK